MGNIQEEKRNALIEELTTLRKGRGVTPLRLEAAPTVKEIVGDVVGLEAAIRAMGEGLRERALLAAYNLEGTRYENVTMRRNSFAVQAGRERGAPFDPVTIRNYEDDAIAELALALLPRAPAPVPSTLPDVLARVRWLREQALEIREDLQKRLDLLDERQGRMEERLDRLRALAVDEESLNTYLEVLHEWNDEYLRRFAALSRMAGKLNAYFTIEAALDGLEQA